MDYFNRLTNRGIVSYTIYEFEYNLNFPSISIKLVYNQLLTFKNYCVFW